MTRPFQLAALHNDRRPPPPSPLVRPKRAGSSTSGSLSCLGANEAGRGGNACKRLVGLPLGPPLKACRRLSQGGNGSLPSASEDGCVRACLPTTLAPRGVTDQWSLSKQHCCCCCRGRLEEGEGFRPPGDPDPCPPLPGTSSTSTWLRLSRHRRSEMPSQPCCSPRAFEGSVGSRHWPRHIKILDANY